MDELALSPVSTRRAVMGKVAGGALLLVLAACAPRPAFDAPPRSIVFFNANSAALDGPAMQAIGEIVADAKAAPRRQVIVAGYADVVGTPASNRTLSQLRAQVVADELAKAGVDRGRIVLQPRGQTGTDPGVESRRVEVSFGP